MKVKELIEKLKEFDPDKEIALSWIETYFRNQPGYDYIDISLCLSFIIERLEEVDFINEPSNTVNIIIKRILKGGK